jgi:hypothetical protein
MTRMKKANEDDPLDASPWSHSKLPANTNEVVDDELLKLRRQAEEELIRLNAPSPRPAPVRTVDVPTNDKSEPVSNISVFHKEDISPNRPLILVASSLLGLAIGLFAAINAMRANRPSLLEAESRQQPVESAKSRPPQQFRPDPPRPKAATPTRLEAASSNTAADSDDVSSQASSESATPSSGAWQACLEDKSQTGVPPQPGETWWPVVGPSNALADARRFCRQDAFINRSGNVQISSFRDQETADSFAKELSSDSTHPWRFWVGDPSVR